jgi:tetratricopeptide (TPR) repeat protein
LSVLVGPGKPGYEEGPWIRSEDVNVEHLLDVFTSIDANSDDAWAACGGFMHHLYWHKKRLTVLGPKIEGLPDDHPSKPQCLFWLSLLFESVGNDAESKRLLIHTLKLQRERGNDLEVAHTLRFLARTNRFLELHQEGIQQAEEALGIYQRHNDILGQGRSLKYLARLLLDDNQPDAAEEAASRAINLLLGEGDQFEVCQCHDLLGDICHFKGETKDAVNHYETALGIASSFNWRDQQFWILYSLAELFSDQGRFDDAHAHIERAKSHTVNDAHALGYVTHLHAWVWYGQRRFEEAKSEALSALGVFEKLGATEPGKDCRTLLQKIEKSELAVASHESDG